MLALQGVALSFTMIPCMREVKNAGGNFVTAAFIYELGYSINILIWGNFRYHMTSLNSYQNALVKGITALGFALIYLIFGIGLPTLKHKIQNKNKFDKFDEEK